jgi:hypothetical protein
MGGGELVIESITLIGVNHDEFVLNTDNFYWTISAGRNGYFTVYCSPKTEGYKTATIQIIHSAEGSPALVVLQGEGEWVSDDDNLDLPSITSLIGNFPNPFNPDTTIRFGIFNPEHVYLDIYNVAGQRVRTLLDGRRQFGAGIHDVTWNGRDDHDNQVSSGIYFYRMRAGEYQSVRRMILLK